MAKIPTFTPKKAISRVYKNFAGADFTSDSSNVQLNRSPNCINMYKDYKSELGQAIETRPGFQKLLVMDESIYGIHFLRTTRLYVLVHSGNKLYYWDNYPSSEQISDMTIVYNNMAKTKSRSFVYDDMLYLNDGINYLFYDGENIKKVTENAYIPTTTIARNPIGGGTILNPVNLLQPKRRNSFLGNGTDKDYTLDTSNLDGIEVTATVNGIEKKEWSDFTVNRAKGIISFNTIPPKPSTVGQDNVVITFAKTVQDYANRIEKCILSCIFDNRIFYSGNDKFPNALFNSQVNDPTYISDTAYYQDGSDNVPITGLLRVGESLMIIKKDDQQDAVVYYHTPSTYIDNDNNRIITYPTKQGLAGIGCISMWGSTNFLDEPVFISRLGLECFTKLNLGLERSIEHKSSLVDGKLVNESDLENIHLEEWNGYLMCLINGHIYLADNRQRYENKSTGQIEYEWYYWDAIGDYEGEIFRKATLLKEYNGRLFFGTENGSICEFILHQYNDNGRTIYSCWTTPSDNFGNSNHVKTTNKRGGIANLKTFPNSACKLNEITDKTETKEITRYVASGFSFRNFSFIDFSFVTKSKSYMEYKIKEKKWNEISLTFYSDELNKPFGVFSATLEAFIGGYVK